MSRARSNLPFVFLAFLVVATALGACKKTGSEPTGYGVNVTIDATMLSAGDLGKISTVKLTVVDTSADASAPMSYDLNVVKQIQGGHVTFTYVPNAAVGKTDTLELGVDAFEGTTLLGSGSSGPVTLKATAVDAKIVLAGLGDGGVTPGDGGSGKPKGTACVTDNECGTGYCTDGVCCNERCNDVCVSCNQTGSKGTCTPYAVDTDPEMECVAVIPTAPPVDDGGATDATDEASTEAGASPEAGADASSADASAASTDADDSDALVINTPDGGFMTMPNACAGTCGGARACKYPDATKSCGAPFCNSRRDVGTFVCDGNGGCAPTLTSCVSYACNDTKGACRTQCAAHIECVMDDYCSGNATCLPKKADGLMCATGDECTSGACSGGVCCNTACDGQGLTCVETGHVGQCQCQGVTCGAGIACQIFYQDADGDGYGNRDGVVGTPTAPSLTAKAGCMGSPPPTGYVADNTDCDDGDPNANPKQTAYFATPTLGKHNFDYNCSGANETETPQYVSCKFCSTPGSCATTSTGCSAAGQSGSFQCPQEGIYRVTPIEPPILKTAQTAAPAALTMSPAATSVAPISTPDTALTPRAIYEPPACCGCSPSDKTGFLAAVGCGVTGTTYTCTSCSGVGGGTAPGSPTAKVQRCR